MADGSPTFAHTRGYDLAVAVPLVTFYGLAAAGNAIWIAGQWTHAGRLEQQLQIANEIAALVYFGLQAMLLLVRRLPVAKSDGFAPRAAAILGANINLALLLLPHVHLDATWLTISTAMTVAGTLGAAFVLAWLGRGFAIFPEARRLAVRGPYRFIRHPLYLAEAVATLGIMLAYRQPWALLVVLVAFAFQLRRMRHEEDILGRTWPDYEAYRRNTARLLPGVY